MADIVTIDSFCGNEWRPEDELRLELSARWLCIELYSLLEPGLLACDDVVPAMREGMIFADGAPDELLITRGPATMSHLDSMLRDFAGRNRPKVSWQRLGDDFRWLCRDRSDLMQRGIPVGWIAERFHLPAFGIDEHCLWHGHVGVGTHAGHTSFDEMHLLSDMFFLLTQARETLKILEAAQENHESLSKEDTWYSSVTRVKSNVCGFARQAVVTACSFVEAFVNGLATDFVGRTPGLLPKQKEFLSGKQNGRWISLDRRLEGYPQLLSGNAAPPFNVCDRDRRDEPFRTFFAKAVEIRDGAMHPGKGKAVIWLGPFEWTDAAAVAVDSSLEVARLLWMTCKAGAPMPKFLWELDRSQLLEYAEQRFLAGERLKDKVDSLTKQS